MIRCTLTLPAAAFGARSPIPDCFELDIPPSGAPIRTQTGGELGRIVRQVRITDGGDAVVLDVELDATVRPGGVATVELVLGFAS